MEFDLKMPDNAAPANEPNAEPEGVINKHALALLLGTSVPTVTAMMDRYPDFPVVHTGSKGIGYGYRLSEVIQFLDSKKSDSERAESEAKEQLAEIVVPWLSSGNSKIGKESLKDRLRRQVDELDYRGKLRREANELNHLVWMEDVREKLFLALQKFTVSLSLDLGTAADQLNLPQMVVTAISVKLNEGLKSCVKDLESYVDSEKCRQELVVFARRF